MKIRRPASYLVVVSIIPVLSAAESDQSFSLWSMIQQGGWAMIPLAFCSLALIYFTVHCFRETRASNFGSDALADQLAAASARGDMDQVSHIARQSPSALGRALIAALPKYNALRHEETISAFESEVAATLELEENAVARSIHYFSVIANIAPMIGLLGTVSGMIGGFQTMSAGGMGRPELFAGDIGEALITTATGLCIGIPAMIAHSYFNNNLNTLLVKTARRASLVSDSLNPAVETAL